MAPTSESSKSSSGCLLALTVSFEGKSVVSLPSCCTRRSVFGVGEASGVLSGGSESTHFTVLVNRVNNPIDTRVVADSVVVRINADDFKVLVCGILVYPVGVKDPEIGASAADTCLSDRAKVPLKL
eukprot:CAMPEP_0184497968 /NCGR_PEP_ID=MMETSP0113_2-20130426/37834_1 /TAXON_ID=91329 /ORGANISM="Norrisiella sphaerica, Strain BC52" /LENGTH=125 /DNA_ID=CAMNT_0026885295 /DNA_START=51 /DNA_END=428 /DNA_ORIENTATION=-